MSELDATLGAEATSPAVADLPVLVADRYRIEGLLGIGGMGRVYRAFDTELEDHVALKLLRPEYLTSTEALTQFKKEVRLARKVTHQNVARIFDIAEHAGQKFMTMELIAGDPLDSILRSRGRASRAEALRIVADACRGVAAAHRQSIIHRDLKPGNIMIERDGGRVVVTDFGLARGLVERERGASMAGVVGTPAYMAPEQVGGQPLTPAADVYALGLILWELLVGTRTWSADSPLLAAARRVMEPPPRLADALPDVDPRLAACMERALAQDPASRYADADELLAAVEAVGLGDGASSSGLGALGTSGRDKTVAVLRFSSIGGGAGVDLAVGLSEDLGDVISMTPGLRLRHTRDGSADPIAAGRRLDVDVVVAGSVRHIAGALRVSVRVVGVADGFQLWAGRFERPVGEALALNDEVGETLARVLSVEQPAPRSAVQTPEAVEAYLVLREAANGAFMGEVDQPEFEAAVQRALAAAPDDPRVVALGLAVRSQYATVFHGFNPDEAVRAQLDLVMSAAPNLALSWLAKACVEARGQRAYADAVLSLRRALSIDPGQVDALAMLSHLLAEAGSFDDALELAQRARWADPQMSHPRVTTMFVQAHRAAWSELRDLALQEGSPGWPLQGGLAAARYSLWAGRWLSREPESLETRPAFELQRRAIGAYRDVLEHTAGFETIESMVMSMLQVARPGASAHAFLRQQLSEVAAFCGHQDRAWDLAKEAMDRGLLDTNWLAGCPLLEQIRSRPEATSYLEAASRRAKTIRDAYRQPLAPL